MLIIAPHPSGGGRHRRMCRRPVVLEGVAELSNWLETAPERRDIPLTMVSQTTSTRFIWDS